MAENNNLFSLLRTKEIIAILDGDKSLGDYTLRNGDCVQVIMPYLSGPDLCDLSTSFGLPVTYKWGGTNLSRWQYFDKLLEFCISHNRCTDLLAHLFSKKQFSKMLGNKTPSLIEESYQLIVSVVLEQINGVLYFGGHELVSIGSKFAIRKIGEKIVVEAPKIKLIDRNYIKSIFERATEDVEQGNFDSAITKSRRLLEEVFCYVIEKKGDAPSDSGSIAELYKQVKGLYKMHADANTDRRINMVLSGFEKIISGIAEMRNKDSDAHGVGALRVEIEQHHARLFVNASSAMADFILSVEQKDKF